MEIYKATIKENPGLVFIVSAVSIPLLIGFYLTHQISILILGIIPILWLLAVRLRYQVVITDSYIEHQNLFKKSKVNLSDIKSCFRVADLGYPYNRTKGPFVYAIATPERAILINLKFFPLACTHRIHSLTKKYFTYRPNIEYKKII